MPSSTAKRTPTKGGADKLDKTPVSKATAKKRRSSEEDSALENDDDFGDVTIDMASSDEEADSDMDEESNDEEQEFPELDSEDDQDDESEIGDEDLDLDNDDYLEGDSLDEADLEQEEEEVKSHQNQQTPLERLPEIEADYDSDSSTEETQNTIGNIPADRYKDLPHIGYDIDGKRILRPATGDELDKFLATMDDPDSWKTVRSDKEGKDIVLNDEEIDIIRRLEKGMVTDADYNPYEPTVEWFSSKTEVMPLDARPEPKRRFVPSKWEAKKIMKIVRAIRLGRIVPNRPKDVKPRFYNLWGDDDSAHDSRMTVVPAPKMKLPQHEESYNPPEEYLPNEDETKKWNEMDEEERQNKFLPKKFASLRHVPAYDQFIQERFHRCLDLYLAPRVRKKRLDIDPDSLLPKLPNPKDLRPFPTHQSMSYRGHTARIRALSVHSSGLYILSGSDDGTCRIWEVLTGRCLFTWNFGQIVHALAWNPDHSKLLFAVSVGDGEVLLVSPPKLSSDTQAAAVDSFVKGAFASPSEDSAKAISWERPTDKEERDYGYKMRLQHDVTVKQVVWHRKGDYFATVSPENRTSKCIMIHQVTKHQSQVPFRRLKGLVQKAIFHPTKTMFLVATQTDVRVYDLLQQESSKKLLPGARWISSIDVHPGGDNVIVGSYDKKISWFDLDLGAHPYKSLKYHKKAIRQVTYHKRYPLFASSSDDGTIQVFYGMVYSDLLQNPLIVPVKILRGHTITDDLGVLNIDFHPTHPWIFSAGADGTLRLWT